MAMSTGYLAQAIDVAPMLQALDIAHLHVLRFHSSCPLNSLTKHSSPFLQRNQQIHRMRKHLINNRPLPLRIHKFKLPH